MNYEQGNQNYEYGEEFYPQNYGQVYPSQGYEPEVGYEDVESHLESEQGYPSLSKPVKNPVKRGASIISDVTTATTKLKNEVIPPVPDIPFEMVDRAEIYQDYYSNGRSNLPESLDGGK